MISRGDVINTFLIANSFDTTPRMYREYFKVPNKSGRDGGNKLLKFEDYYHDYNITTIYSI